MSHREADSSAAAAWCRTFVEKASLSSTMRRSVKVASRILDT